MGKASRWIRNLLMGKREDRAKETGPSVPAETCMMTSLGTMVVTTTPKVRRRWSFKRPTSGKGISHRSTKSFDSIFTPKLALLEYETQQSKARPPTLNAHAAATRIQAAYRSYLARRALRALRGLVKLQALARGYLVRKQMNAVVRSIHAVMAIQVRARIHRIQMVEESPVVVGRRKSNAEPSASDRQYGKEITDNKANGNSFPTNGGLRSRSGRVYYVPCERVEYGPRMYSSGRLSVSQREYQLKTSPSPSTLSFTDSSSTTYDGVEEFSLKMARRNSRRYSASPENKHPYITPFSQCQYYIPSNSTIVPNYMTNTKSSKAKTRSQSEPRQRPKLGTKQKSKRSSSMDGKNDKQNEYPWLSKLYRSDKSTDEGDCDSSISAMASISKHMKTLVPFEVPPMNMY
ncbi:hypothetical protein C2S51_002701 [Perilla frutescens var. frutescens]|nr:hypothetical protein C2S51_002701 [Perilla frutescens var. frutescens]